MHTTKNGATLLPWLALFTIWIVWGSTYLGISAAVESMPPFLMTGARFLFAVPILLALAYPALRRGKVTISHDRVRNAAILGLVLLIGGTALGALAQTWLIRGRVCWPPSHSPRCFRASNRPERNVPSRATAALTNWLSVSACARGTRWHQPPRPWWQPGAR